MREETVTNETELIARARAGDADAFCALAALHGRRLYTLALRYCRDASDAEDLSQEVWLRALRSLETFRAESSFYTWLRRIAVNLFLNDLRAARSRPAQATGTRYDDRDVADTSERDPANDATAARPFDAESAAHDRLLAARVRDALAELSPQQRVAFLLKHDEGMTYEEIAREMGCSAGTVKKSLARAVVKLRARMSAGDARRRRETDAAPRRATGHRDGEADDKAGGPARETSILFGA